MKHSIRVLQVNGNETSRQRSFTREVLFTLAMLCLQIPYNSNVNIYNINNNKMRKSNIWKFHMIHYLISLAKTMECTPNLACDKS